jgi:hypothetical protein
MVAGLAAAGLWAGVDVLAGQENLPGMPTIARTFVLNRSAQEAIPVVLHAGVDVQPVSIVGAPEVRLAAGTTVAAQAVRQRWEYRRVAFGTGEDPTSALNEAGADGWEAVGLVSAGTDRTTVLLKRPR